MKTTLDISILSRLQEAVGPAAYPGLARKLLASYQGQGKDLKAQISEALTARDLERLRYASHSLKSSAANLGLLEFQAFCQDLERRAKAGDPVLFSSEKSAEEQRNSLTLELEALYQAGEAALLVYLDSL